MLDLPGLLCHSCRPKGIAVAQGVYADPGGEIQILLPFRVPGPGVFSLHQSHVYPAVGVLNIRAILFLDLLKIHG